jgi:hypothetical protein
VFLVALSSFFPSRNPDRSKFLLDHILSPPGLLYKRLFRSCPDVGKDMGYWAGGACPIPPISSTTPAIPREPYKQKRNENCLGASEAVFVTDLGSNPCFEHFDQGTAGVLPLGYAVSCRYSK